MIQIRIRAVVVGEEAPRILESELHAVRAGHVRRGGLHVVTIRVLPRLARRGLRKQAVRQIDVARAGEPGRRSPLLFDAFGIQVVVAFEVAREAAFDQELVADGRRPLDAGRVVVGRVPHHRRCGLIVARVHRGAAHFVDAIVVPRQLVARTDLPGEASQAAVLVLRIDALRAQRAAAAGERRLTGRDTGHATVRHVGVGNRFVDREQADRAEEPDRVPLDWSALGVVGVAVPADLVD